MPATPSPLGPDDLIITASTLGLPSFPDLVRWAVAGGFAGLSVWPEGVYGRAQDEGLSDTTLRAMLGDAGLVVQDVDAAVAWVGPGDPGPPYLEEPDRAALFNAASALGASFVNVLLVGRRDAGVDLADVAAAFAGVCDEAADHGLVATLEFTYRGFVTTVSDAAAVVSAAGRPNARLLVDTWQYHWGGSSLSQLGELPPDLVAAVQVSDAPGTRPDDLRHATRYERLIPGDGVIDLPGFVRVLRATGSMAPLTVEVLNDELLAHHGPDVLARRLGEAVRQIVVASANQDPDPNPDPSRP
jgi:sugar phosphate isomerase/epimerase